MPKTFQNAHGQQLEDGIASHPGHDYSEPDSMTNEGGTDPEWLKFNILSLGCPICTPNLNSC